MLFTLQIAIAVAAGVTVGHMLGIVAGIILNRGSRDDVLNAHAKTLREMEAHTDLLQEQLEIRRLSQKTNVERLKLERECVLGSERRHNDAMNVGQIRHEELLALHLKPRPPKSWGTDWNIGVTPKEEDADSEGYVIGWSHEKDDWYLADWNSVRDNMFWMKAPKNPEVKDG